MRLFMSVDLVGSTAFKAMERYSSVDDSSATPQWVAAFRVFYQEFPIILKTCYEAVLVLDDTRRTYDESTVPRVWKTVGDEIVFCNRVHSIEHVAHCISAFVKALDKYTRVLEQQKFPLKVKGAGWLAAFPAPNISIAVFENGSATEDGSSDTALLPATSSMSDASLENLADTQPHKFDFLGKGIDTGFRIAKNAADDRLVVSVQLAYVLARAANRKSFPHLMGYHGRESLKGVIGGSPYPVISIDTERDELQSRLKSQESDLTGKKPVSAFALADFLVTFMEISHIEMPYLPFDGETLAPIDAPASYKAYAAAFEATTKSMEQMMQDVAAVPTAVSNTDDAADSSEIMTQSMKFLEELIKVFASSPSSEPILVPEVDGDLTKKGDGSDS
jgi:hypothetical protein